jgi:heme exporter protein A
VPDRDAAIVLRGLSRDFGERPALGGIDVELDAGATLAVLGPNGSGKTTLLRVLAGLLRPSGGEARVLGCPLPSETWRLRGRVGYLSHTAMLYRDLTSRENLRLSARLHGIEREEAGRRIESSLAAVGMEGRADDRVAELSAGMAQRVAACLATLHRPELLLLDEPDSHLDAEAREQVGGLISPAQGRTRVLVSHERERALAQADRVLEL